MFSVMYINRILANIALSYSLLNIAIRKNIHQHIYAILIIRFILYYIKYKSNLQYVLVRIEHIL